MSDKIARIKNSLVQHGKFNNRIYLMKLAPQDLPGLLADLDTLSRKKHYTKIFAKAPEHTKPHFQKHGYTQEAIIPKFFKNKETALFMCKYHSKARKKNAQKARTKQILALTNKNRTKSKPGNTFPIHQAKPADIKQMAHVYKKVFKTYPFPIHDPKYLLKTMKNNVIYYGIKQAGKIVSLGSCEMDKQNKNVEMTDFATLPPYQGQGMALQLLIHMEKQMKQKGIKTTYTIARALCPGVNIIFTKLKYKYAGTLINNTNISGHLENMNIWHKSL